jgi:uncharacterized protein YqiB (DUF1249 family)
MNYARLEALMGQPLEDLRSFTSYRLTARGFMDLVVEVLPPCPETGAMVLSIAHYFEQNGDLCQDPEMTVRIFLPQDGHHGTVEAFTFQQSIPPIYQVAYPKPGYVAQKLKRELNSFLTFWLRNLKAQGHRGEWSAELITAAHTPPTAGTDIQPGPRAALTGIANLKINHPSLSFAKLGLSALSRRTMASIMASWTSGHLPSSR